MIVPTPKAESTALPPGDLPLNLHAFAVNGPGDKLTDADIDRTLHGGA